MNGHNHIRPLVIFVNTQWISSHAFLERIEASQLQHEFVQPQAKGCGTKFVEPLPQEAVLCHNLVKGDVLIIGEKWPVVRVDVHDVTVDG